MVVIASERGFFSISRIFAATAQGLPWAQAKVVEKPKAEPTILRVLLFSDFSGTSFTR
jgi:hypothetical protein